jgi:hypothetical protein
VAISDRFALDEHEFARAELAMAVMNVAREDSANVERLREAGLRAMHLKYPSRFGGFPATEQNGTDG